MGSNAGPMDMIRPHHIAQIPTLNDQQKAHWKEGLTKLWATVDNPNADPETKQKAISRIKEVSRDLMMKIASWKATQGQAGRPPSQGQQPLQPPQPPQEQSQPQVPQQQNNLQQIQQQPQGQGQPGQVQAQPQVQPQGQGQGQGPPGGQGYTMSEQARNFLRNYTVYTPAGMNPTGPEWEAFKTRSLRTMQGAIMAQDSAAQRLSHYNRRRQALQGHNQEPPPDLLASLAETEAAMTQAKARVANLRSENEKNRVASTNRDGAQSTAPADAASPNTTAAQPPSMPNPLQAAQQARQQPQGAAQPMYPSTSGLNDAHGQAGRPSAMSPATGTPGGFQAPTQGATAMQQQPQQSAIQQQPQQQPQHPAQMPPRPLPNPQQAYASQHQQPPATPMNTQGPPQPLSHQAAMTAAARTYSEQQQQQPQRSTPNAGTPGQSFPSIGPNTVANPNAKMPIPKTLNVPSPTPVSMGPARPTFGGGAPANMMGQPAIVKPPGFELEGGERVLSKKKLDELVRQVTGGGETDSLTPDVEEALLSVADDFVDTVITAACRLAKIRPNSTLDIRDVQIILERNYNIRVPGYSLDEIRTVRKFMPAQGWTQKMNAVQAAKVMGKNDS